MRLCVCVQQLLHDTCHRRLVLLCSCCACASPQIGHHFSKHGRVMDVVMVKDFGPLLNLAATATNLEQQRKAEATKVLTGKAGAHRQSCGRPALL